jgi:hypothetical protein
MNDGSLPLFHGRPRDDVPPTPGVLQYRRRPYLDRRKPDKRWKPKTVERICQEAVDGVYAGILRWGKRYNRFAEDAEGSVKESVVVDTKRPLVDIELLQRVQLVEIAARTAQNDATLMPRMHNGFLLSNLVRCGNCGRAMAGYTTSKYKQKKRYKYRKYRCAGRVNRPGGCKMPIVSADKVELVVLDAVFAETSRVAPKRMLKELHEAVERRRRELTQALAVAEAQKQQLMQRRDQDLDAIVAGQDLPSALRQALISRAEASNQALIDIEAQERTLQLGLESLEVQARNTAAMLSQPNLDPARWAEPEVNSALQRALRVMVRKIHLSRQTNGKFTIEIWLSDALNGLFSEIATFESAWGSNPPTRLVTPPTGFEDQGSHRATSALVSILAA